MDLIKLYSVKNGSFMGTLSIPASVARFLSQNKVFKGYIPPDPAPVAFGSLRSTELVLKEFYIHPSATRNGGWLLTGAKIEEIEQLDGYTFIPSFALLQMWAL